MTRYATHLCLVSDQATPNLLPLLDDDWRPTKVVLACTAQKRDAVNALQEVVNTKGQGMVVEVLDLPDAYDYGALSEAFLNFLAQHEGESVALNVTGGTKLMAVAAQEAFRAADQPVFYVNVENDQVLLLGEKCRSSPLRASLRVHELLRAHGYAVAGQDRPQVPKERRDLAARLIDISESYGAALGQFNFLAYGARNTLQAKLTDSDADSKSLDHIIRLFEDAELVSQKSGILYFKDESARLFANGGWLESYVYDVLQTLRGKSNAITDVVTNLRIPFEGKVQHGRNDKNELDIAFLARNTLHIIECKTANLAQTGAGGDDKGAEAIYKMQSLLKLGGLRTKGMVVDYRGKLSASPANLERAKEAHILVVSGRQLRNLSEFIQRNWLSA